MTTLDAETRIYELHENDLARELVGQRIAAIDTEAKTITLHSGTVLAIEDAHDCCSWYNDQLIQRIDQLPEEDQ